MTASFQVRPFAFMRLTHEAIRDGVARCLALAETLDDADDLATLRQTWEDTRTGIRVHAALEDRGFFPMLDARFDGPAERAGFRIQHSDEDARHQRIEQALAGFSFDAPPAAVASAAWKLRAELASWGQEVERHLVHEEDVMMPLTQQVADTVEGRAAAVRSIIDTAREDTEQLLLPWVVQRLEASRPYPQLRMFVAAWREVHGGDPLEQVEAPVRRALSPAAVTRLEQDGALG